MHLRGPGYAWRVVLILLAAAAAACHERTNEAAFSLPPIAVRVATVESQPMLVPARAVQLSHGIASVMVVGCRIGGGDG
ncbi:hypothetical protein [Pusillimonas noertemannii]|uniref:Uncharacterized protein n=1 Tax=Pusillimonas noertemannii TaxID=305977 RepID=A0A2U1CK35_9BURK|nr:hypothetical protein [Pusillimonas noertemannii]NYT69700.1 hypothetical protein [Pusillimonas noertemannii]PVY61376.1 hypothetical protein C7440_2926 [Pusillimonas noertemannii]TFL09017.1 hypothetical protein CSC72_14600 [Pusillimonas noertemannii]